MGSVAARSVIWALLLVLASTLATPAFTCKPNAEAMPAPAAHIQAAHASRVHAGLVRHDPSANPTGASRHCPGCPVTAECAVSCLDVGLLPATIPSRGSTAQEAWTAIAVPSPVGVMPPDDVKPPETVF